MTEADVAKLFTDESERSRAVAMFREASPALIAAEITLSIDPDTLAMSIAIPSEEPVVIEAGATDRSLFWDLLAAAIGSSGHTLAVLNMLLACERIRRQSPNLVLPDDPDYML